LGDCLIEGENKPGMPITLVAHGPTTVNIGMDPCTGTLELLLVCYYSSVLRHYLDGQ
jgi:hypothetical protein